MRLPSAVRALLLVASAAAAALGLFPPPNEQVPEMRTTAPRGRRWEILGAVKRTRTSTPVKELAPQASASTNSAMTASREPGRRLARRVVYQIAPAMTSAAIGRAAIGRFRALATGRARGLSVIHRPRAAKAAMNPSAGRDDGGADQYGRRQRERRADRVQQHPAAQRQKPRRALCPACRRARARERRPKTRDVDGRLREAGERAGGFAVSSKRDRAARGPKLQPIEPGESGKRQTFRAAARGGSAGWDAAARKRGRL